MTGTVVFSFTADTLTEAKDKATTKWQELIEDETAVLPWETDMRLAQSNAFGQEGRIEVIVTIELDDVDTYLAAAKT